jgi:hypothetical protein
MGTLIAAEEITRPRRTLLFIDTSVVTDKGRSGRSVWKWRRACVHVGVLCVFVLLETRLHLNVTFHGALCGCTPEEM